jgi:hypothetical protein
MSTADPTPPPFNPYDALEGNIASASSHTVGSIIGKDKWLTLGLVLFVFVLVSLAYPPFWFVSIIWLVAMIRLFFVAWRIRSRNFKNLANYYSQAVALEFTFSLFISLVSLFVSVIAFCGVCTATVGLSALGGTMNTDSSFVLLFMMIALLSGCLTVAGCVWLSVPRADKFVPQDQWTETQSTKR